MNSTHGKSRLLATTVAAFLAGTSQFTHAASGWTDFGVITEFNQQPPGGSGMEMLFIRASVTSNPSDPSACYTRDGFYLAVTTDQQKRLFAMLMLAKATGQRIRVFVTTNCHAWGFAEMQGLIIE
jgi:hypothetical protein